MPYVLIQHEVRKYEVFEPVFKDDETRRRRMGSKGGRLYRNVSDPRNLVAVFEWDTAENARRFADSYELKEAVEWAGSTPSRAVVLEELLQTEA
jgi:heme-degrading monooxygenase HmoA